MSHTYDWLLAHGVMFADKAPDAFGGTSVGDSDSDGRMHAVPMHWIVAQTGQPEPAATAATRSTGDGLVNRWMPPRTRQGFRSCWNTG